VSAPTQEGPMEPYDFKQRDERSTRHVIVLMSCLGVFLVVTMTLVTLLGHRI